MQLGKEKAWIQEEIGIGVESIRQLPGSTSSLVYEVKTTRQLLVLRQFNNEEWLLEEPDLVQHEVAGLQKALQIKLQTPDILAFDETGDRAGMPSVLMTEIAGGVVLNPDNFNKWTDELAKALVAIHQLQAIDFTWKYGPYVNVETMSFPDWTTIPDTWRKAIEIVQQPPPAYVECFIHRDYHPANVLWEDGQVTGIVDWGSACRGPTGIDVGHCRLNIALLHGVEIADLFLDGRPTVYKGWLDFGFRGLTDQLMEERLDAFIESVVERK